MDTTGPEFERGAAWIRTDEEPERSTPYGTVVSIKCVFPNEGRIWVAYYSPTTNCADRVATLDDFTAWYLPVGHL
jgi:hypothetical protein